MTDNGVYRMKRSGIVPVLILMPAVLSGCSGKSGDGLLYVGALLGAQNDTEKVTFLDAHDEDVMNKEHNARLTARALMRPLVI